MARRAVFAGVAALVLGLAGCGGGETAGPGAPTSAGTAPAASTAAPPSTPATVPRVLDFTARTLDGKDFAGASLAGKPAVLWFWAPWCPKCRAAAQDVATTARKVTMVGVPGLSEDVKSMRDFVSDTRTTGFTHLGDGAARVWQHFGVTSQHTFVLIGSDGIVKYRGGLGASELASRVAALT